MNANDAPDTAQRDRPSSRAGRFRLPILSIIMAADVFLNYALAAAVTQKVQGAIDASVARGVVSNASSAQKVTP